MSEPMRKRKQAPESYTPKKPEIAKMMELADFDMSHKIMENEQGVRLIREKFEYRHIGKLRFIGLDAKTNPGLGYHDTVSKLSPLLNPLMPEYASDITDWCFLEQFQDHGVDEDYRINGIGRFFRPGTPVPEGLFSFDIPTGNIGYGVYCGDEHFKGDPFDGYVFTRDQILSDGIEIPYPQGFWSGWQYIDGEPHKGNYHFGYMFGVGAIK